MNRYQLQSDDDTIALYTPKELQLNKFECKLKINKEEIQSKVFTRINGQGVVNLGSNKIKKRSGKLTFHKLFNKEIDYQDWTNQLNFLIKNNQKLTLVQLDEKNSRKF